ncbi:MAG: hypothetical protein Q9222_002102 [Ikaeria aurantiellina]
MDIPNEIILEILSCLPIRDLKQARLVNKSLASLGAQLLVDTLYLTPRERDMEIFDKITQHPEMRKSVKRLHYDSAQLRRLSLWDYFDRLCEQFSGEGYNQHEEVPFGSEGESLKRMIEETTQPDYHWERFDRCQHHVLLVDGHRLYSQYSQEQGNILNEDWSARACKGLRSLGPLESVTIQSAWDLDWLTHCDDGTLSKDEDAYDYDDQRCRMFVAERALERAPDKKACQQRLMGPPTARAYHPAYLAPAFAKFDELAPTKERLCDGRAVELFPDVSGLRTFLGRAHALEHLGLEMPHDRYIDWSSNGMPSRMAAYTFQQIFPPISGLRDTVGFLLLAVPKLDDLVLGYIGLTTLGTWEEIVEGLRHYSLMSTGSLNDPLEHVDGVMYGIDLPEEDFWPHFLGANVDYICSGGRHPGLPAGAPDSASLDFLIPLDKTLDDLRGARRAAGLKEAKSNAR